MMAESRLEIILSRARAAEDAGLPDEAHEYFCNALQTAGDDGGEFWFVLMNASMSKIFALADRIEFQRMLIQPSMRKYFLERRDVRIQRSLLAMNLAERGDYSEMSEALALAGLNTREADADECAAASERRAHWEAFRTMRRWIWAKKAGRAC